MISDWESWAITTDERIKHDAQFQFLKPVNGYVTGEQVKLFFLKSGLQPLVLGQIWTLADMDADGKLDKKEFSIAMFLIRKKLEGMQLPPTLPSGVKSDPQPAFLSSSRSPLSSLSIDANAPNDKFHTNGLQHTTNSPVLPPSTTSNSPSVGSAETCSMSPISRPKYRLLFNQHDRTKRGFITGVEARGIFIKSGLSQQILAHIWNLADTDKDGNLNCDEFCIAAYLIEQALNGSPPPPSLPPGLLPSQHPNRPISQTQAVQRQKVTDSEDENKVSSLTFEDKRRENFRQGQVELDRRKQELAEKLRQEEEARLEKERQERERQENIRLEKERQAVAEAERQAERMRELETQREVRRRQAVEARAKAWRAAEAQRQLEAEKQRVDALKREKSQTQTALEQAIAHRASLLESANAQEQRRRELDARLMVAQNEVDAHKSAINEMRQKRDAYQRDIRELTEQVEAAKAELTRWQREHEQLSLRVSTGVDTNPTAEQCKTLQANRELRRSVVSRLKAQLQELDSGMTQKGQELASRRNRVEECEQRSSRLVTELMDLHRLLEKKMHEYKRTKDPSSERGGTTDRTTSESDKEQYEVMFDFTARHPDELTLTTGMIFNVYLNPPVTVSPGWLYGECNGIRGMFPESYVRKKITGKIDPFDPFGVHKARVNATPPVQPDRFVPDGNSKTVENRSGSSKPLFACLALYPYESTVTGDLNLAVNDVIQVHTIRDDWYEGFNERSKLSGMFPANYTRKLTAEETALLRKEIKPSSPTVEVAWPAPVPPETAAATKVTNGSSVSVAPSAAASIGLSSQADPFSPSALPPLTVAPSFTGTGTATTTTTTSAAAAPTTVSSSSSPSSSPNTVVVSTKPEFARVIAPYTATAAGQLSLQPGQVVQLRKRSPKGWWEGELQQRGRVRQFGWFPADYVRVIVPSGNSPSNPMPSGDTSSLPLPTPLAVTQRDTVISTAPGNGIVSIPSVPVTTIVPAIISSNSQPTVAGPPNTRPSVEMMQAIFSYKAAHADELTFEEGAIITVLGRDEPEWWRGRLQSSGVEGLFPVNYVRPYTAPNSTTTAVVKASHTGSQRLSQPSMASRLSTLASLLGSLVSKRDLVVKELILTEESYVNDLEEVQTVFHEPMRKSMLLTDVQVNRIFLNWSELLVQSKELLSLFIARVDQFVQARSTQTIPPKICIGDILVQQFPKFHVYRVYCARQTTAAEALQTYLDENPRLQQLVRLWEQNTRTKGLPLSTYLLKPMQRLTKYKLLIERILEHTHQSHPDFGSLTKARGLIADVLNSINTAVGTKILDRRIDWLRSRVLGEALALDWLISTAKRPPVERIHLLFYGTVFKIKSNRELIGFLFNRYFLLTSPNFSTGGRCFEFPVPGSNAQTDQTFTVYRQPIPLSEIFVTSGTINDSGGKLFNSLSNLPDSNQATCVKPNSSKSMSKKCGTSSHDLLEDVHLLFSLFRSSKPREPFLTLRAPNPAERDRWVMHLWNAIRKCSGPADADRSQPSRPISNARSECSIFIELVRFWINSTSPLEIRFDCAIDQQPRQSCIASFEPGQPAHLNGPAMKFMHDGNSPPKMCIRAFDHLSWPDERQLGYAEQVLSNINNWDSNGTTQRLALANSDCSLQVEVHLQLVI